jgi:hypothetical protein
MLAIFCHIGNYNVWLDVKTYLDNIKIEYDLYVNISKMVSEEDNHKIKETIKAKYIFELPNKGCDTGPLIFFMNYLRENNITYDDIIHLHTKTDDKWRRDMMNYIFSDLENKLKTYEKVDGLYRCPYDYYNYFYDREYLDSANVEYIKDWNIFDMFTNKEYKNDFERLEYLQKNPEYKIFSPHIFTNLYETLFEKQEKYKQTENIKQKLYGLITIILKDQHKIYYCAGTFLLFKHKIFNQAFKTWNLIDMYNELEEGKPNDLEYQSRTHSLERVIPIGIQLYKEKNNVVTTLHLFDVTQIDFWITKLNLFTLNNSDILNTIYINIPNDYNIDSWNILDIQYNKLDIRYNIEGNDKVVNMCNYIYLKLLNKKIVFIVSPNIGVDIGGYFYCLKEIQKDKLIFDYIIKVHTKTNQEMRNKLSSVLHIKIQNINNYTSIYPSDNVIDKNNKFFICNNIFNIISICRKMLCKTSHDFKFVGGTMFIYNYTHYLYLIKNLEILTNGLNNLDSVDINWCHLAMKRDPNVINQKIYNYFKYLKLKGSDNFLCDGCIEHSIERIFGLIHHNLYNDKKIYYIKNEEIEYALYGGNNVYIDVKDKIKENIKISNEIFSDPIIGVKKQLILKRQNKNIEIYNENEIVQLQPKKLKIVLAILTYPRDGKTTYGLLNDTFKSLILNQNLNQIELKIILIGDDYPNISELLPIFSSYNCEVFDINNNDALRNKNVTRHIKWAHACTRSLIFGYKKALEYNYDYILLSADDELYYNKIDRSIHYIQRYNNPDLVYSLGKHHDGRILPGRYNKNNLLLNYPIPCNCIASGMLFNLTNKNFIKLNIDFLQSRWNYIEENIKNNLTDFLIEPNDAELWEFLFKYFYEKKFTSLLIPEILIDHFQEGTINNYID